MLIVKYRAPRPNGGRYMSGHIVAFENGIVYDPARSPLTESRFNVLLQGWRVEKVVQIPKVR